MGLLDAIRKRVRPGRRGDEPAPQRLTAKYDNAQTTHENQRHWANADGLAADAAIDPNVRRTLRNRSRYECANNSYAYGIVKTLGDDTIGTGPKLRFNGPSKDANRKMEASWQAWADRIDLAGKLRLMRMTRARDGEVFALFVDGPERSASIPRLDIQIIEADQCLAPFGSQIHPEDNRWNIDGVIVDKVGRPQAYTIAEYHPGSNIGIHSAIAKFIEVPANRVIHYFRADRPGQHRGIPELTPALGLFAQMRRYTLAVLSAAETAATFAGVLYTDAPAGGEAARVAPLDPVQLERAALLTMPGGWKMEQLRSEQPTGTYDSFKAELLNEIARAVAMPYNVAAFNSASYNYSSSRLDMQVYQKSVGVEREVICRLVLEPLLAQWYREAVLLEDAVPARYRMTGLVPHSWMWNAWPHVDPAKEAAASQMRLQSGLTTLADEYAAVGEDWEDKVRQRHREVTLATELGVGNLFGRLDGSEEETEDVDEQDTEDED